jgi:hypothetical protein
MGAEMAESEFLAFLDDDDELIPDTLAPKIDYFREHPEVDVLVTDGFRVNGSKLTKIFPAPTTRGSDLVEAMMRAGWGAGALTLRRQSIDLSANFDAEFHHLEWTLTALSLASRYRCGFLDEPTYRYYEDTPNSLWKSAQHSLAATDVWCRLSKIYAATPYAPTVRRRYGLACHNASWECARQKKIGQAWRLHAKSLLSPGGASFLLFSARLLFSSLRRAAYDGERDVR